MSKKAPAEGSDPRLQEALEVFKRGDYVRARELLRPLASDTSRPEGARQQAQRLFDATQLDLIIPKTAAGCLGLLGLVVVVTHFIQP